MTDSDIIEIKTLTGYIKVQCNYNDSIEEIIRKALNNEYDWTFFGLQTEENKSQKIRRYICPKLQWCHAKLLIVSSDIYLTVRHFPLDINTAITTSILTIRYLKDQLCEEFSSIMPNLHDLELGLDLACLVNHKTLKTIVTSKNSTVDMKTLFPPVVIDKIKSKHLKKLIQPKIAELDAMSENEYLKRLFESFQKATSYDQDEFKCELWAGEGIPFTVIIGPRIDIITTLGSSNEWRTISYFKKIENISISISNDNSSCQIKIFTINTQDPLVLTFHDIDEADNFAHLLDAYTGYNRLKSNCPLITLKTPKSCIDLSEIDKSRVKRVKILDSGQFGDVYKAVLKQTYEEVEVAVKLCKAESSDEDRQLFLAEAEIMQMIDHPHIVQLMGVSQAGREWWIVMEYCGEGQLLSYLIEHAPDLYPEPLDLLMLCYQLSTAMAYLHTTHRILHRDIAARNILLLSPECAKLSDFGKAVQLDSEETYYRGDNQEKLPVKWAAMESLAQRIFMFASDVWGFGVLTWEIMSRGRKPYAELANNEVYQVLRENKRLPRLPGLPDSFHTLLLACWAADPQKRPSFTAVKNKLNEIKIEMRKMVAEDKTVSMITGLNKKPPIKPTFYPGNPNNTSSHSNSTSDLLFGINQSMPDLVHGSLANRPYQQKSQLANNKSPQLRYSTQPTSNNTQSNQSMIFSTNSRQNLHQSASSLGNSRSTIIASQLDVIADNFKYKTELFVQSITASQSCSVLQLKGFGLTIRYFLQELEQEIPPHPVEHELTQLEGSLIRMFKGLIRLRITTDFSGLKNANDATILQMAQICDGILAQTDRIMTAVSLHLQYSSNNTNFVPVAGEYS